MQSMKLPAPKNLERIPLMTRCPRETMKGNLSIDRLPYVFGVQIFVCLAAANDLDAV